MMETFLAAASCSSTDVAVPRLRRTNMRHSPNNTLLNNERIRIFVVGSRSVAMRRDVKWSLLCGVYRRPTAATCH